MRAEASFSPSISPIENPACSPITLNDCVKHFAIPAPGIRLKSKPSLSAEHLHTIWVLPPNDADYATRWRLIKASFSRGLPKGERISQSRRDKGERGIWQRRYWEHTLRDELDLARHVDYIHFNPVKHGHVKSVSEWPYSSFHRFVESGRYSADWGGGAEDELCCSER